MPTIVANILVLTVLGVVVFLAARSLYKKKKSSSGCNGNCGQCGGCH